jgi:hypothetical protein
MTLQTHPLVVATNELVTGKRKYLSAEIEQMLEGPCGERLPSAKPPVGDDLDALKLCLPQLLIAVKRPGPGVHVCTLLLAGISRYASLQDCLSDETRAFSLAIAF